MARPVPVRRVLLASLLLGLLGSCGSNPYPGEPPNTLHVFLKTAIKGLDPVEANDQVSGICVINLYDQLYEYKHVARPFDIQPCLAEAMPEVSEDRLTYTIRMKQGVQFVDDPCFPGGKGRECTAHDVVFCFKRLMDRHSNSLGTWIFDGRIVGLDEFAEASGKMPKDPHRSSYDAEGYPDVEGLRALDDYTIQIKLKAPYDQLRWVLAMNYGSIYAPEAVAAYGLQLRRHAVGTGPYVLEYVDLPKKLVLRKNPKYREAYYPSEGSEEDRALGYLNNAGKRLPCNDRVVATVFKETQPQWLYFMRGYLDRTSIPKDNFDGAIDPETNEMIPEMQARGVILRKDPKLEVIYDCFNMEDAVVGRPAGEKGLAIRRAMSLASDDEWAIRHLYNMRATRLDGPIIEEFPEYDPEFRNPWKMRDGEDHAQAVERAKKILADAGMPGGKGIPELVKDVLDNEVSRTFFLAYQRDMAEIGISVKANVTSWPQFMRRLNDKKAQVWGVSWGADYPDAQNFLQLFYGPNVAPGPNKSNFQNDEFDRLYEQSMALSPGPERTKLYRRRQEIVVEEAVWSFRYRRLTFGLVQPWMEGYRYNDIGEKYFQYCSVDDEARALAIDELNEPTLWPLLAALGAMVLLFALTAVSARRMKRAW